jgi:hypothetical protein
MGKHQDLESDKIFSWHAISAARIFTDVCAGTGYGKSLIFEGVAALGGKGKVVMVICPLKALKYDQVCICDLWLHLVLNSCNSGMTGKRQRLSTVVLNKDTTKTA